MPKVIFGRSGSLNQSSKASTNRKSFTFLEKPFLNPAYVGIGSLMYPKMPLLPSGKADIQTHNARKYTELYKYGNAILNEPVLNIGMSLA